MKELSIVLLGVLCIALIVEGASHLGTRVAERDWQQRTAEWKAEWEAYEAANPLPEQETPASTVIVTDSADK